MTLELVYESSRTRTEDGSLFVKPKLSISDNMKSFGKKIKRAITFFKALYAMAFLSFFSSPGVKLPKVKKRLDRDTSVCYSYSTSRIFKYLVSVVRQL